MSYSGLSSREQTILQRIEPEQRGGIEKALLKMDPYTRFTAIESIANNGRWYQPKAYYSRCV
jgi:hypothetical protein